MWAYCHVFFGMCFAAFLALFPLQSLNFPSHRDLPEGGGEFKHCMIRLGNLNWKSLSSRIQVLYL